MPCLARRSDRSLSRPVYWTWGSDPTAVDRRSLPARGPARNRKFADSPLEEGGFELVVPPRTERPWETQPGYHRDVEPETRASRLGMPYRAFRSSGTEGSNPPSPSRQSVSAVKAEAVREKARTLAAFCGWLGREKGRAGCEPGVLRSFSLTDIDAVPPPASSDPIAKRHAAAVGPRPGAQLSGGTV